MKILTSDDQEKIIRAGKKFEASEDIVINAALLAKITEDVDFAIEYIERFSGKADDAQE